jgi:hypothetical protein
LFVIVAGELDETAVRGERAAGDMWRGESTTTLDGATNSAAAETERRCEGEGDCVSIPFVEEVTKPVIRALSACRACRYERVKHCGSIATLATSLFK